jgi:CheY-like chemotaxis protein
MARVLVVDDRPEVARAIARMLYEHETSIETNPRRAVARIVGGEPFDIALIDFNMPDMTGRDVSDAVAAAGLARPPIILMMSGRENVTSLFETGRAVLIKPFEGAELRELVSALLHEGGAPERPHAHAPWIH